MYNDYSVCIISYPLCRQILLICAMMCILPSSSLWPSVSLLKPVPSLDPVSDCNIFHNVPTAVCCHEQHWHLHSSTCQMLVEKTNLAVMQLFFLMFGYPYFFSMGCSDRCDQSLLIPNSICLVSSQKFFGGSCSINLFGHDMDAVHLIVQDMPCSQQCHLFWRDCLLPDVL